MNRGDEFDQSTLYVCMEIQQWKPFVQWIYTKKKAEILPSKLRIYNNSFLSLDPSKGIF
jgi:hypothetical protein